MQIWTCSIFTDRKKRTRFPVLQPFLNKYAKVLQVNDKLAFYLAYLILSDLVAFNEMVLSKQKTFQSFFGSENLSKMNSNIQKWINLDQTLWDTESVTRSPTVQTKVKAVNLLLMDEKEIIQCKWAFYGLLSYSAWIQTYDQIRNGSKIKRKTHFCSVITNIERSSNGKQDFLVLQNNGSGGLKFWNLLVRFRQCLNCQEIKWQSRLFKVTTYK